MTEQEIKKLFPYYNSSEYKVIKVNGKVVGVSSKDSEDANKVVESFKITKGAFWLRLTLPKLAALKTLAKSDVMVEAQLQILADSEYINVKEPTLIQGIDSFIEGGLLTQEDKDRILAPASPEEIPGV